jgi:glycosyltransferase involved in cell wall biosynthesis
LRIGGGTRIKIYEGMAVGKATVSTLVGAEGLEVHHEHNILLADDPRRFANYVVKLLRDEDFRRKYEAAAAASMRPHDWSVITQGFVNELQNVVAAASPARPRARTLLGSPVLYTKSRMQDVQS